MNLKHNFKLDFQNTTFEITTFVSPLLRFTKPWILLASVSVYIYIYIYIYIYKIIRI